MITIDRVSFGYGRMADILTDYSLTIPDGGRVCLSGPSGVGKSTILRLLLGLESPRSGSVTRTGSDRISAVFQENRLVPHLTTLQNVTLFAPDSENKAVALLTELGLRDVLHALPSELSGGMKRRAALARALCHPFDILVLDEAFTGLDEDTKAVCLQAVNREAEGRILVMVTHDPTEAEALNAVVTELTQRPM